MDKRSTSLKIIAGVVFIVLEVVSIVLIVNNSIIQRTRIVGNLRGLQTFFWKNGEHLKYYFSLQKTNDDLAAENAGLKNEVEGYRGYLESLDINNTDTLFSPDSMKGAAIYSYMQATVILNTVNKQHNYLVLNKGAKDGVKLDMGVISTNGIVGFVSSVSEHYSYVTSFLNTSSTVSAKISSNDAFGPMSWDGKDTDRATIKEIPVNATPEKGDTVVTSGYSLMYPPGIPLGTVGEWKIVNGEQLNVTVDLFQNFNSLHLVKIVTNNRRKELKKLIKR
ncbi:MAG: rod shape-determining protein MreC [Bacteroidales bacterium]|jgi:rod shape-determining protein MreC|nr:rod shape-determining protein MreC [Bacteroidales bacterium]MCI2121085.1 rod shape-determining protein MreC [Bacteroidales bacterium]MCI2144900.1 rod shape-determining protein MreC [Bacteroidales bacterium]